MNRRRQGRQLDPVGQRKRAAVGVPQPPLGMDEQADRTLVHRLAAQCEALEWQLRRRAVRIEAQPAELLRERADHSTGPAVERMRQSIARLGGALIATPLLTAGEAQQNHRCDARLRQQPIEFPGLRVESAAHRKAQRSRAPAQPIEGHLKRPLQ